MANAYTSVATTPGLATELVRAAYDKAVKEELHNRPSMRQFVSVRPGDPAMRGSSITLEKFPWFDAAAIAAAKTPLTEEADVDSVKMPGTNPVTITPQEYGFTVTSTRKLEARTFAPFDGHKARAVADHMGNVIDSLVQDVMVGGTQVSYSGAATSNASLVITDVLKAADVRRAVAIMRSNNVPTWFGGFYAAVWHPFTILDLRTETGPTSWRNPSEYGVDQSEIWRGEISEFEGVRVVSNPTVRWVKDGSGVAGAQIRSIQNYIFGMDAIVEQALTEPEVRVAPATDKLGRFQTIGWYGDIGWAVYEQKALYRVVSASSLNANLI